MSFRDEYKGELESLFQLVGELGRAEPALAPLLGRGADPSVSRLLEGLAFSFGRLAQRLDDDMPEVLHPILETLCPDLLRPVPSATIVELVPSSKVLVRQTVEAGSTFGARAVEGVSCTFRSDEAREVCPWSLSRVSVASAESPSLTLSLDLFPGTALADALPASLPIFFAHPAAAVALDARAFLLRHVRSVVVRSRETDAVVHLPASALTTHHPRAAPDEAGAKSGEAPLVPMAAAFLALRDFFVFPQRFAFVTIEGLHEALSLGPAARSIEIVVELAEPVPRGLVFDLTTVRLHAVAVHNVFRAPTLALDLDGRDVRRALRLEGDLAGGEVYAVESVALVSRALRKTTIPKRERLYVARSAAQTDEAVGVDDDVRYEVHRAPSVLGASLDLGLAFVGDGSARLLADKVSVEVGVLATNGARAVDVELGGVCLPRAASPSFVAFRSVVPVTRSSAPSFEKDRGWQFVRLAKMSLATLTETETLAEVVAAANVPAQRQWPDAKPGADRFLPILRVDRKRGCSVAGVDLRAGALVCVTIDTKRLGGAGEARLFGEVLLPLLAATVAESAWVELSLVDSDGRAVETYPRAKGARSGL